MRKARSKVCDRINLVDPKQNFGGISRDGRAIRGGAVSLLFRHSIVAVVE
jgi:hypothetical protein